MKQLIAKELLLAASPLPYLFVVFGFMALIPGYPILLGAFFVSFGIFQSFQLNREQNDITYTAMLPVAKCSIVRGKFMFALIVEAAGFAIMAAITIIRMTWLADAPVYVDNALMSANFVFLGFALVVFAAFNGLFISGFFKTAYFYGKPFIIFIIVAFVIVGVGETLHHIPGLQALDALGFEHLGLQLSVLVAGAMLFIATTMLAIRRSERRFESLDL